MGVRVYNMFPLHVSATKCPGSDTAAWICSGGCGPGSLCASSELVGRVDTGHTSDFTE